ncbi:MAG TPA: hypothetical protein VEK38_00250, partial [Candidatus Bathyarchaeia archaeon]|nr:hypothetical protein [Candidatus Bathyarchaeia archaeon]
MQFTIFFLPILFFGSYNICMEKDQSESIIVTNNCCLEEELGTLIKDIFQEEVRMFFPYKYAVVRNDYRNIPANIITKAHQTYLQLKEQSKEQLCLQVGKYEDYVKLTSKNQELFKRLLQNNNNKIDATISVHDLLQILRYIPWYKYDQSIAFSQKNSENQRNDIIHGCKRHKPYSYFYIHDEHNKPLNPLFYPIKSIYYASQFFHNLNTKHIAYLCRPDKSKKYYEINKFATCKGEFCGNSGIEEYSFIVKDQRYLKIKENMKKLQDIFNKTPNNHAHYTSMAQFFCPLHDMFSMDYISTTNA